MKHAGILAIASAIVLMFVIGCGGGSNTSATRGIVGIWTGTTTQTRAVGDTGTIEMEYKQKGTAVSGTARLTLKGAVYTGSFTGTLVDTQVNTTVNFGTYGMVSYTGTVSGSTFTGAYTRSVPSGGTEVGDVSMVKSTIPQTLVIAGSYTGTSKGTTDTQAEPLSMTITQSENMLTINGTVSNNPFTGTGMIMGNKLTAHIVPSAFTIDITGTISGSVISGTFTSNEVENGQPLGGGTFTITKSAAQ